jgi:hypothetical protein
VGKQHLLDELDRHRGVDRAYRALHSEKPERFYDIVRAASFPPYGEAFQRTPRSDFANLFAETVESQAAPPSSAKAQMKAWHLANPTPEPAE